MQFQFLKFTRACIKCLNICLFEKEQLLSIPLYKVQASQVVGIRTRKAMTILKAMVLLLMLVSGVFGDGKSVVGNPKHMLDVDKCGNHCQLVMNSCISNCRMAFPDTFLQCQNRCVWQESVCSRNCKEKTPYP